MKISIQNDTVLVSGLEQLVESQAKVLQRAITTALSTNPGSIRVDLSKVEAVDCTGLGALVTVQEEARRRNPAADLLLIDPPGHVRQLLGLTRVDRVLTVVHRSQPKKAVLPLFVFVDACGWEIIRDDPFAREMAPHRRRLRSVYGYSSACIPSILSGRWPAEHRNWCYFVRDPANSPFRALRPLRWLPRAVTSRRIFRRWLSRFLRGPLNFRGYFDLYNIPFRHISLFDFSEKKSPLQPGGLNCGPSIFDYLEEREIPYHVSDPSRSEADNLRILMDDIIGEQIEFAFLYWPELDGLMHRVGNDSPLISEKLRNYERWLERLVATANHHYEEVRLYIFSDHGMANCDRLLDLRARIDELPLKMPRDYTVVYDSTMARFWFADDKAREQVIACLNQVREGRILDDAELERLGVLFPDRYFGDLIFQVEEGVLIVPSDMGERPLRGMHGYHPDDPHSYAAMMTNVAGVPADITDIPHVYRLMTRDAEYANAANRLASQEMDLVHPKPAAGSRTRAHLPWQSTSPKKSASPGRVLPKVK